MLLLRLSRAHAAQMYSSFRQLLFISDLSKLLVFVIFNYIVVAEWSKTRFKGIKATTAMKEYRYKCSGCKKPTSDVSTLLYYLLPQVPKIDGSKSDLANTQVYPTCYPFDSS